jgi:hypothetical protein
MFPLSITQYVQFGICAVAILFSAYLGYSYEHRRFMAFKQEIEAIARAQEAKVESIQKQQALVTKGIENEYEAKIAAIRNYYKSTSVWNNPSSSKVPGISATPSATDVIASYNQLAGFCAETTAQTIALQDWIREQAGIK